MIISTKPNFFICSPLCCQHHLICPVDQRISVCGSGKDILPVVCSLSSWCRMGCKIRYCIDKAVAIVSYVFQIGSVKVAHSHVFPQSFYATLLLWGEIFFYRKQNLDIIHDLFFRQPDSPQIFKLFSKSRHILVCQEQGILRFLDLSADIPCGPTESAFCSSVFLQ